MYGAHPPENNNIKSFSVKFLIIHWIVITRAVNHAFGFNCSLVCRYRGYLTTSKHWCICFNSSNWAVLDHFCTSSGCSTSKSCAESSWIYHSIIWTAKISHSILRFYPILRQLIIFSWITCTEFRRHHRHSSEGRVSWFHLDPAHRTRYRMLYQEFEGVCIHLDVPISSDTSFNLQSISFCIMEWSIAGCSPPPPPPPPPDPHTE